MLQIKSFTTGEILGIAASEGKARAMAITNGWRNWFSEPLRDKLELLEDPPETDPYNMRGRKVTA